MASWLPWKSGMSTSTRHPGAWRRISSMTMAKARAPPTRSSSRLTLVMTACCSPSVATASATRRGSSKSIGLGAALGHGAESAAAGAQVAQHHEGRGLVVPALADVGAMGALADRMQVQRTGQPLQVVVILAHRARAPSATPAWACGFCGRVRSGSIRKVLPPLHCSVCSSPAYLKRSITSGLTRYRKSTKFSAPITPAAPWCR